MTDESQLIVNLHTALRRYIGEHISSLVGFESPQYGVFNFGGFSFDGNEGTFLETIPRMIFLNNVRWELASIYPETLRTLDEARELFDVAAQLALGGVLNGKPDAMGENAVRQEYEGFSAFMKALSPGSLQAVEPLPYFRALTRQQHIDRLAEFGQRWNVEVQNGWFERDYYPVTPLPSKMPSLVAFDAAALLEANGTQIVQRILSARNIQRIFIFEANYPGVECEISGLDLGRAISSIVEFVFSESLDWMIHTSWQRTITLGGEWLIDGLKQEWQDWEQHLYEYFDFEAWRSENSVD